MAFTTVKSHTFDGVDLSLPAYDADWENLAGLHRAVDNRLTAAAASVQSLSRLNLSLATSQRVTFRPEATAGLMWVLLRGDDNAGAPNGYALQANGANHEWHCFRMVNGGADLVFIDGTYTQGETFGLEVVGSSIKAFKAGVQQGTTFTDTTYATAGHVLVLGPINDYTLDDLLIEEDQGAPPPTVVRVAGSHAQQAFGQAPDARSLAYGGTLTLGSLLVVDVGFYTDVTLTVEDSANGAYAQASSVGSPGAVMFARFYRANNGATAPPTVVVTPSAAAYLTLSIDEYTGVVPTAPLRAVGATGGTGGTVMTTGTIEAMAGDLVLGGATHSQETATIAVTAPFVEIVDMGAVGTMCLVTAWHAPALGSAACEMTASATLGGWIAAGASFITTESPAVTIGAHQQAYRRRR
jgi:hypothetical protein